MIVKNKVILYAEDDPAHFEIFLRSFKKKAPACKVIHMANGEQAISYLLNYLDNSQIGKLQRPDLIITDLHMPKIDGLTLIKNIRSHIEFSDIPIVVLSTSTDHNDISEAYRNRANSFLVKPCDGCAYHDLIEIMCKYWINLNRIPTLNIS